MAQRPFQKTIIRASIAVAASVLSICALTIITPQHVDTASLGVCVYSSDVQDVETPDVLGASGGCDVRS